MRYCRFRRERIRGAQLRHVPGPPVTARRMGPVRFSADRMFHDSEGKTLVTITAKGMLRIVTLDGNVDWPVPIEAKVGYDPADFDYTQPESARI